MASRRVWGAIGAGPPRRKQPFPRALAMTVVAGLMAASVATAHAEDTHHHAISKIGSVRFGPGFRHFDWVNPDAPKGGTVRLASIGNYDSFNGHTYRGNPAPLVYIINDTLLATSPDEPATAYGLLAEWVAYPDDLSSATFHLRGEARFHDGRPVTPEDVIFSLDQLRKASPSLGIYLRDVAGAEKSGEREVTFRFARKGSRDMAFAVGQLPIVPRHYWTGTGANGEPRDLTKTTLEPPLGSGPYRIETFEAGRSITYARVPGYWGRDLAVNRGRFNFDRIHVTMFRDDIPQFEAVKGGDIDVHQENSSKRWATQYTFPAMKDGRMRRLIHPSKAVAQMQGFVLNLRRAKFADPRVRHALTLAYDFETANTTLFYGLYTRLDSYFQNSPLQPVGMPEGLERQILEKWRGKIPEEVFGAPYRSPVNATPQQQRANLREALRLLDAAGWKVAGGVLRDKATGAPMTIEFLINDNSFDRIVLPYQRTLEKIGIKLTIRVVDASQYVERLKNYEFEMIVDDLPQQHAPGNELRETFGSAAADRPASRNRMGLKSPAVDGLVEEVIYAPDRTHQIAAARALDRVLMWSHTIVPQWYNPDDWFVVSRRIGHPAHMPSQDAAWLDTWWINPVLQSAAPPQPR